MRPMSYAGWLVKDENDSIYHGDSGWRRAQKNSIISFHFPQHTYSSDHLNSNFPYTTQNYDYTAKPESHCSITFDGLRSTKQGMKGNVA